MTKYRIDLGNDLERATLRATRKGEETIIAVFVGNADLADAFEVETLINEALASRTAKEENNG